MNEKITFQQLAEHLSLLTGGSQATTETFIRELFAIITDALSRGEDVKVKSIGIFSPSGNPEHPVLFIPDKELAETINLPFSCFESVELADDIDENLFIDMPTDDEVENQDGVFSEKISVAATNEIVIPEKDILETSGLIQVINEQSEDNNNSEQLVTIKTDCVLEEPNSDTIIKDENSDMPENITTDDCVTSSENDSVSHNHHCIWVIVISLLIGLIVGYTIGNIYPIWRPTIEQHSSYAEPELSKEEIIIEVKDTVDSNIVQTTPLRVQEEEIVTDTIGTTRFLTTMSRKYYGNMIFWVYIYEENKEKLDNPNRIKPGTVVVIPDAEKYKINKDDSTCIAKAKLKAIEIYAPYQK